MEPHIVSFCHDDNPIGSHYSYSLLAVSGPLNIETLVRGEY